MEVRHIVFRNRRITTKFEDHPTTKPGGEVANFLHKIVAKITSIFFTGVCGCKLGIITLELFPFLQTVITPKRRTKSLVIAKPKQN